MRDHVGALGGHQHEHALTRARFTVRDTRPGLADEGLPRAFDRFYLYDLYRSERAVGSGLGLAIVKELTAAMVAAWRPSAAQPGALSSRSGFPRPRLVQKVPHTGPHARRSRRARQA